MAYRIQNLPPRPEVTRTSLRDTRRHNPALRLPNGSTIIPNRFSPLDPRTIRFTDASLLAKTPAATTPLLTEKQPARLEKRTWASRSTTLTAIASGAVVLLAPALAFAGSGAAVAGGLGPIGFAIAGLGLILTARLVISKFKEARAANPRPLNAKPTDNNPVLKKFFGTIIPPVLFGITAVAAFSGMGPFGIALATTGLYLASRFVWSKYQAAKPENYQSPASTLMGNNPTPRKLLKTMVLPAFGAMLGVGLFMNYSPLAGLALGLGFDAINMGAFYGLVGFVALKAAISTVRDVSRWIQFKTKGIQRNVVQQKLIPQILTNVWLNFAWASQIVLMAHFSKIFATQFVGLVFNFTSNIANGLINYAALGKAGLIVGGAALLWNLLVGARRARVNQPLEKQPHILVSALKSAAILGTVAAAATLAGGGLVATNLLSFAVALAFAHGAIHSTRSQEGGLRQKDKIQPIFDLQSTQEAVRSSRGAFRTVYKPGVDMVDPLVSSYVMMLITEGANWILNAISGAYEYDTYQKAGKMIDKLINKDAREFRAILRTGYKTAMAASTQQQALEATAVTLENVAKFLDQMAAGDLGTRSGLPFLKDGLFSSGLPGSKSRRSDQDLRVHGEHIRLAARLYETAARNLRGMGESFADGMDLPSLKASIAERLNDLHTRAFVHADTHPGRFFTNFLPDSYNAKQFVIDLCSQVMSDFVGAMDVVVMNQRGELEVWLVPMKVVKDVRPDYREVKTIETDNDDVADPRFGWYERDSHDIGDSLCEIAYIDNSAHFARHGRNVRTYPTAEVVTPPQLEASEYYDVVYKNGSRLRIFGDGRHQAIGELPAGASALIMLPGTKREGFVAKMISQGQNSKVLYDIPMTDNLLLDLANGKVPLPEAFKHRDANYFHENPYFSPRWRFMYPTEFTSVSDADQMDRAVTNLRLFHTRSNPHLRVMMARPRKEILPFMTDMVERPSDSFLEAGIAVVWMMLRVKLADGRELYMPLNMNKENERTFGGDLWKYIDETKPVEVVAGRDGPYLEIPYRETATKDPAFRRMSKKIGRVPVPLEMREFFGASAEAQKKNVVTVNIDPIRYGETGGPIPVVDALFVRRNSQLQVTDKDGVKTLPDRVAQLLIFGSTSLLNDKEIEHMDLTLGHTRSRRNLPWTDRAGRVHLGLDAKEYEALKPWLPTYHGAPAEYIAGQEELVMETLQFTELCNTAYQDFTYRRFMPDVKYRNYFDPAETD